jgi:outer membrane protein
MKTIFILPFFICLPFFSSDILAAEIASLSLSHAIQLAEQQNPKIKAALCQVSAADHRMTQAKSGFLPQVYFTETFNHTNTPMWAFGTRLNQEAIALSDFDPERLNHPDPTDNFNSAISVEWPVFAGGQTWLGVNQARLDRDAQDLLLTRTRQEVIAQAAVAYAGLLLAHRNLEVVQKSLETAKAHYKMINARFKNGLAIKSDLLRTQVHIAELEQDHIQAESRVTMAEAALNAAMGASGGSRWRLSTSLEKGEEIKGKIDEWITRATSNRPDMHYMEIQERMAEKEIQKSKASHLPNVNLIGSYELNSSDFTDSADNYTLGAMMRVNLYSGQKMTARIREAEALSRQVKAMRNDLASGIEVQIRQAFLQAQSARHRINVSEETVSQAEEALRIIRNRYENGLLTLVSLLDAEVSLQAAHTSRYSALHDYMAARIQLSLAAGTLDTNFK